MFAVSIQYARPILVDVSAQQSRRIDLQGLGDPHHHEEAWIATAALYAADIGQVDASLKRKLFLSQLSLVAQPPNIPTNYPAPVRHYQRNDNRVYIL